MGLSIVHSIVTKSGGYITAASELGNGSTFEILLPSIGTFKRMSDVGARGGGSDDTPTILLVDNDDTVRKLMHAHLSCEGFQLLEAGNPKKPNSSPKATRSPFTFWSPM